ncbi:Bis(5'-adenosyl)-triphosphatase enpp4 [Bulinus truncatus]|nr:Bis(5'-adenosyl)-triphosphatase enpp4 [Bulinus truncatus]
MAANLLGMAFIPYYDHLMNLLKTNPELHKTAKGIFKQVTWGASGTIVGGVIGGPFGAMVGGLAGSVIGYRMSDDYQSLIEVLQDFTDDEKAELVKRVQELDKVNLIVTSDHGMTSVDVENKLIDLTLYANNSLLKSIVDEGPTANLIPQLNKSKELVEALSKVQHLNVMLKEEIPERFHLKNNKRVMPVFAYADEGWLITTNVTRRNASKYYGDHGYDNGINNMNPFFIASGPDFKTGGQRVDPIQSVDIYPLICHLLGIQAAPNNGSLERAKTLLRDKPNKASLRHLSIYSTCFVIEEQGEEKQRGEEQSGEERREEELSEEEQNGDERSRAKRSR